MKNRFTIYIEVGCPYCAKVKRYLSENKIKAIFVNIDKGNNREELIGRGGKSQVPYLIDNQAGVEMYESEEILGYLRGLGAER